MPSFPGPSPHTSWIPQPLSGSSDRLSVGGPIPLRGSRPTYPIAQWMAPLAHFKSNLKITSKNVFYDDYPRALINSTNPLSKPETWASFPIPRLSQPINHWVLLIITSRLLFSPSTRLPLPPDGATAKSLQRCSPPSHVHPEARVIFQKCKPHHVACLGGMPATWGWRPALVLGAPPALAPATSPLVLDGGSGVWHTVESPGQLWQNTSAQASLQDN